MHTLASKRQLATKLKAARRRDASHRHVAAAIVTAKGRRSFLITDQLSRLSRSRIARLQKSGGKLIPLDAYLPRKRAIGSTPRNTIMLATPYTGEYATAFAEICEAVGVKPTARQFRKWEQGRGTIGSMMWPLASRLRSIAESV